MSKVPCKECSACCRGGSIITVSRETDGKIERYSKSTPIDAFNGEVREIHRTLAGDCAYLENSKCAIYEDRPLVCRKFDCRILTWLNRQSELFGSYLMNPEVMKAGQDRLPTLSKRDGTLLEQMKKAILLHK